MSDDSPSHSSQVTSKYFSKLGMDESLSDFQEKKTIKGPKEPKKPAKPTQKPKKRIRGQKDIRTALQPKKNELVTYANDFDKVCKESGLDVDSEQLQLAIALSKSLQNANDDDKATSSIGVTAKDRTGKIRKTLQEYGFKVPVVNAIKSTKRRVKKYRKDYKLILYTEEEKLRIISDRYTEVLFRNIEKEKNIVEVQNSEVNLYYIGTQISYEVIRSDNFFYIEDLIKNESNSVGSLLKNWSEIPGRPVSPIPEKVDINFTECVCSQVELDSILSGPLNSAQDIVKTLKKLDIEPHNKSIKDSPKKMDTDNVMLDDEDDSFNPEKKEKESIILNDSMDIIDGCNSIPVQNVARSCSPDMFDDEVSSIMEKTKENSIFTSQEHPKNTTDTSNNIMDFTNCVGVINQKYAKHNSSKSFQTYSQLSQKSNLSKRRSNDFMEITNCVAGSSQPLLENIVEENIDLTQYSDANSDEITINNDINIGKVMEIPEVIRGNENKNKTNEKELVSLDLTQSSHSEDELPMVQISGRDTSNKENSFDATIILNEDEYKGLSTEHKNIQNEDKDKDVNTSREDNSFIMEIQSSINQDNNVNDTVVFAARNTSVVENYSPVEIFEIETSPEENIKIGSEINTSQSNMSYVISEKGSKSKSESFFNEFIYPHSDEDGEHLKVNLEPKEIDTNDSNSDVIVNLNDNSNESDQHIHQIIDKDIDLTQSSNSTVDEEYSSKLNKIESPQVSYSSLGKKDNVSIDYDEVFDEMVEHHSINTKQSTSSKCSVDNHVMDSSKFTFDKVNISQSKVFERSNSLLSSCSQNSDVFEISDCELNYSINQSKSEFPVDNFNFGGISVMDELSNARGSKSTRISEDNYMPNSTDRNPTPSDITLNDKNQITDDSFLPMVNVGSSKTVPTANNFHKESFTPFKVLSKENVSILTPSTSEYVIKTDQVTPMLNYDAMTTPERNKELDKYGLKPFKRKRAIQLLTHLYNQTHPILESCSNEDIPSPSKKRKRNCSPHRNTFPKSPKKQATEKSPRKSPRKHTSPLKKSKENEAKSPRKQDNFVRVEDENMYEATTDKPVIRDLECCEEDWVFQKKEKPKLHSCRVPLHIAFHNYVSARPVLCDAILRYEPVNIDDIHKGLLGNGLRFDPKDLLKFLDKKCITVKTADNNDRNK